MTGVSPLGGPWMEGWLHLAADGLLKVHAAGRVDVRRGAERTDRGSVEQLVNRLFAETLSSYQGVPGPHSLLSAAGLPGHFRVRGGRPVLAERLGRLLGLDPAEVQSLVPVPSGDLVVLLTDPEPEKGPAEPTTTQRAAESRPRPAARARRTAHGARRTAHGARRTVKGPAASR